MFVLSIRPLSVERGEELAEAAVVVLDDLRDLRAVGAVHAGRIVVERDEVPDEHERRHRVVADVVGGVAQRELGLRLAAGGRAVVVVAVDDARRIVERVGEQVLRRRLVDGQRPERRLEHGAHDRQVDVVGARLERRQLADVGRAAAAPRAWRRRRCRPG